MKRHPLPIVAHFDFSLVLTYAIPRATLEPLLPPGLELDLHGDLGFVAVAMVQARRLRPAFLPAWAGIDFFLTGYRIFVRCRTRRSPASRRLRGLYILRSDTDRRLMELAGNAMTHYRYRLADIRWKREGGELRVQTVTDGAAADVDVTAHVDEGEARLPETSPFKDWREARRFAGPLPYTFDHEAATRSIVRIEGVREHWEPRPLRVTIRRLTFVDRPPFGHDAPSRLASAFLVEDVPYRWKRGIREPLVAAPE